MPFLVFIEKRQKVKNQIVSSIKLLNKLPKKLLTVNNKYGLKSVMIGHEEKSIETKKFFFFFI